LPFLFLPVTAPAAKKKHSRPAIVGAEVIASRLTAAGEPPQGAG